MTIASSAEQITPIKKGAKIPSTQLTKVDGTSASLPGILNNQPAVIIFYRGSWWSACLLQLAEIKKIEKELNALGYNIFGISPDVVDGLKTVIAAKELSYTLLSDSKVETIEAFGLAFHMDDATTATYKNEYKVDIEKASGQTHHNLPVPAVYIIDASGTVGFSFSNPNHEIRLSNDELMKEAQALAK